MGIERLKWWHWAVLGTLLGFVVGYVQSVIGTDPLRAAPRALEQGKFEEELHQKFQDRPRLKDLRVYPDGALFLVKFERLMAEEDGRTFSYGPWQITPPVPYRPKHGKPADRDRGPAYTVLNYLADEARKDTSIGYSFAWWATPRMTILIWTLGGLVVIGGIWPPVLRLLIGAGFGRPKDEVDYDLSRFKSEKDLLPPPPPDAEDDALLAALEAGLLKNLEGDAAPAAAAQATPAPPAVRELAGGPVAPAGPATPEEDKAFAGEFYPVAHPTPKPISKKK